MVRFRVWLTVQYLTAAQYVKCFIKHTGAILKQKKKSADQQRPSPPRWYLYCIQNHISADHIGHGQISAENLETSTGSREGNQLINEESSTGSHEGNQLINVETSTGSQEEIQVVNDSHEDNPTINISETSTDSHAGNPAESSSNDGTKDRTSKSSLDDNRSRAEPQMKKRQPKKRSSTAPGMQISKRKRQTK